MRSLRGRLTLGVALVLAALLLAFGWQASRAVERSERQALDDRLVRTAELSRATARAALDQEVPEDDRRLDAVLSATRTSVRLLLDGTVLLETGRPPPRAPEARSGLRTFEAGGRRWRSFTTSLEDPDLGGLAQLQVTSPVGPLEARLAALDRRFALLGLLALALASAGAWFAADLVLRPLRRLRVLATGVAGEEDLDRRLPERGPEEVRSLAASLNAMLARLGRSAADRERALAATRRFAADAGHELRTPLTGAQATLSALRRHPGLPDDRRAGMLDDVLGEHRRLVALLDGLQALARGDAAPAAHAPVDLADVADQAASAVRARHPGLDLAADLPEGELVVDGWEPGLRLVLDNLLENAVRHGRAAPRAAAATAPRVRLTVRAAGRGAELAVDDDGPGIPEGARERVLEPFARAGEGEVPGLGLGLALVAQQARHHGGEVHIGTSPLGGARVVVTLPA